ncbi:P-loop containing nucleoside triphosphate hydrolase superfamily protein [Tanacetum coccineum]
MFVVDGVLFDYPTTLSAAFDKFFKIQLPICPLPNMFCMLIEKKKYHGSSWDKTKKPVSKVVIRVCCAAMSAAQRMKTTHARRKMSIPERGENKFEIMLHSIKYAIMRKSFEKIDIRGVVDDNASKTLERLHASHLEVYSTPAPTAPLPSSDMHSQATLAESVALRSEPTSKEVMSELSLLMNLDSLFLRYQPKKQDYPIHPVANAWFPEKIDYFETCSSFKLRFIIRDEDTVAFVRLLHVSSRGDDEDTVAFVRLLNVPWRGSTTTYLQPWRVGYSDTQTHQLAARKEKQMENLKNALRIVHEDDLKEYLPGSDDAKIDDGDKAGNTKKTDHLLMGVIEKKYTNPPTEVKDIVVGSAIGSGSQRAIECELAALYVGFPGVNKWRNHDMAAQIKDVLLELTVDGKLLKDTFKEFPHYLSRSILLLGPGEFYHQRLAKALSREFKTKLLVLDMDNFSAKNGTSKKDLVLDSFSETNGIILYIKDVERFLQSPRTYRLFEKMLKRLSGSTLVIGSRMSEIGNTKDAARLELSTEDEFLLHGLSIFKGDNTKTEADSLKEVSDNEFEKRIRPEVIFEDIGALHETKESLQELVMLPLTRPDLFNGGLLKPCRGILLFGPPGTGKTMLAKAIANEAGASFINVSPTIMFVDEVNSMLGQRSQEGEHEVMRALKNKFMSHWDGLLTKPGERILVLAATNRPFDLDEAIIRQFKRSSRDKWNYGGFTVNGQPRKNLENSPRERNVEDLDFNELAVMTEGYTGSDLKNLCVTASYRPVRELTQQEKQKAIDKKGSEAHGDKKERSISVIKPRHLNMEDMRQAVKKVAAGFAGGGSVMGELKQWNELYGEGGSRKKEQLSYFL